MVKSFFNDLRKFINDLRNVARVFTQPVTSAATAVRVIFRSAGHQLPIITGQSPATRLKPDLLWARSRRRLPIEGPVNHLPHPLKPPICPAQPLLARSHSELLACVSESQFHLCIIHILPFFVPIVSGSVGHPPSKVKNS